MQVTTLRDQLQNWTDWDVAEHALAVSLGLYSKDSYSKNKGIYWSDNLTGNRLMQILDDMAATGILERRDEPDIQFRWNQNFDPTIDLGIA